MLGVVGVAENAHLFAVMLVGRLERGGDFPLYNILHIKNGRFGKWLENWGTPIPVWLADDGEMLCIGSIEELKKASGTQLHDLHKHFVDKIAITKNGKTFKRTSEVFECHTTPCPNKLAK